MFSKPLKSFSFANTNPVKTVYYKNKNRNEKSLHKKSALCYYSRAGIKPKRCYNYEH